jgi:hypothetical protein
MVVRSGKRVMYVRITVNLQLVELALDQQAAKSVREAAALAAARISCLEKYKVTDVSAALCCCLLTDSKQVMHVHLAPPPRLFLSMSVHALTWLVAVKRCTARLFSECAVQRLDHSTGPPCSSVQVRRIARLALQQLLHDNAKQRAAMLFGMLQAVPPCHRSQMAQV